MREKDCQQVSCVKKLADDEFQVTFLENRWQEPQNWWDSPLRGGGEGPSSRHLKQDQLKWLVRVLARGKGFWPGKGWGSWCLVTLTLHMLGVQSCGEILKRRQKHWRLCDSLVTPGGSGAPPAAGFWADVARQPKPPFRFASSCLSLWFYPWRILSIFF